MFFIRRGNPENILKAVDCRGANGAPRNDGMRSYLLSISKYLLTPDATLLNSISHPVARKLVKSA